MAGDFPEAEYQRRINALQHKMEVARKCALLLTTPADIFYTTGFLTRFWESPARPWFVLVPASGAPIAVIPAIGERLMAERWITDIRTWDAPNPGDDGIGLLSDTLKEIVPAGGHIGTPMGLETQLRMPLGDFRRLEDLLRDRAFVDATDVVQRVREVKSEAEIERLRTICAITTKAFDRVPDIVRPAPRLDQVFRRFQAALLEEGADWVSYTAGGASLGGYGDVISPAPPTPLRSGDVLMLDTGAVKDGYFSDFDRNFAIGEAAPDTIAAHEALWDATEHLLDTLRPGQLASEAHALLSDTLLRRGYPPPSGRLGHGLGVTLTEWPSFTDRDHTTLVENMVLTIEPSVEISPGRMLVHEENIILRADGPELLTRRAPRELPVITL